jgi:hypothetical protein
MKKRKKKKKKDEHESTEVSFCGWGGVRWGGVATEQYVVRSNYTLRPVFHTDPEARLSRVVFLMENQKKRLEVQHQRKNDRKKRERERVCVWGVQWNTNQYRKSVLRCASKKDLVFFEELKDLLAIFQVRAPLRREACMHVWGHVSEQ